MTRTLIRGVGQSLLLVAALYCLSVATAGQVRESERHYPRFHRYAFTQLDATTSLDMVKDAKTGVCRLIYRVQHSMELSSRVISVTALGEVPCDPAPVPPPSGTLPPASPIR